MIHFNGILVISTFVLIIQTVLSLNVSYNDTEDGSSMDGSSKVLSRRKRFLTFPDGSSLQLVFCVQTSALIPIGDIFLYGNTAALAWNLPSDPNMFLMFKDYEKPLRRSDSPNTIAYVDETGKVVARVPYKRKTIVNPAFAKRSVDESNMTFKEKLKMKIDRKKMHEKQINRDYLNKEHMEEGSIEFHRSNRVEILSKLEILLTALGRNGRQCVLYKLCETAQRSPVQGTFLEEFLRVVFTLPKGKEFDYEDHKRYDRAHTYGNDCQALYPGCDNFNVPVNINI